MTESDSEALTQIRVHEAVCAERYRGIEQRLGMIFHVLAWGGTTLIGCMGFLIYHLVTRSP